MRDTATPRHGEMGGMGARGFLSRRDSRTKPGVLTPGSDKSNARPERAEEDRSELPLNIRDYQPNMPLPAAPSGRDASLGRYLGLKPQAEFLSPFGTKAPPSPFRRCAIRRHADATS